MLAETKFKTLLELVGSLNREELIWINGYVSGLVSKEEPASQQVSHAAGKITIAFGTETGNSKRLAADFVTVAKKAGHQVKLASLDQYRVTDLAKEENLFVVISTHGEGEPPAAAKKFYNYLHENTISLSQTNYAVLALGDSAYPLFCKTGEDVALRLHQFGGKRIAPLQKCDVDYEESANEWFRNVLQSLFSQEPVVKSVKAVQKSVGRKQLSGKILTNVNLSGRGSNKQTHHIEIECEGSDYLPGDSIGLVPENPEPVVQAVIELVGIDAAKRISYKEESVPVYDLLKRRLNIVYLPERVVKSYAGIIKQDIPATRIDLLNLLKIYPVRDAAQFEEIVSILEVITPRLYSISSSPAAHGSEIHLTVARSSFVVNNEVKYGLCSNHLVQLAEGTPIDFYISRNGQFRLPEPSKDIIMIGPGTGIAPFRSFIAERDAQGATGRNWLFFGDQHFEMDFLYQTEIQNHFHTGVLTRVDLAFSRDQAEKIYVQHRLLEQSEEFFNWLESGASVYLCGSKDPMSSDVERAMLEVIAKQGNRSPEEALAYLDGLKESGRYLTDVY